MKPAFFCQKQIDKNTSSPKSWSNFAIWRLLFCSKYMYIILQQSEVLQHFRTNLHSESETTKYHLRKDGSTPNNAGFCSKSSNLGSLNMASPCISLKGCDVPFSPPSKNLKKNPKKSTTQLAFGMGAWAPEELPSKLKLTFFAHNDLPCPYCWWFRYPAITSRGLVVYSHYLQGFSSVQVVGRISEPSTVGSMGP